jgi:hypothetical protein
MNLRQIAVLVGAAAGVVGEVRRALVDLDRSRHMRVAGSLPVLFLVGTGVAIGAIAAQPDLRRRVGAWISGTPGATKPEPSAAAAPATTNGIGLHGSAVEPSSAVARA